MGNSGAMTQEALADASSLNFGLLENCQKMLSKNFEIKLKVLLQFESSSKYVETEPNPHQKSPFCTFILVSLAQLSSMSKSQNTVGSRRGFSAHEIYENKLKINHYTYS